MRDQLSKYVDLLFAGAAGAEEMKQEILQNTLDRYDDLVAQGKTPEAAYRLAISGIGDINEILSGTGESGTFTPAYHAPVAQGPEETDSVLGKILRAAAIALYILSPIPLFILSELGLATIGLCGTLAIVAVATVLLLLGRKKNAHQEDERPAAQKSPRDALKDSIGTMIFTVGWIAYFALSFATGAWYITWVLFPLLGAIRGLVFAIMDLKEEKNHEA